MRHIIFIFFTTLSSMVWAGEDLPYPVQQWLKVNNTIDQNSRNTMIDKLIADDYVAMSLNDVVSGNREQLKSYLSGAHGAFSDYRLHVLDTAWQADKVWLRLEASGMHQRTFLGVPATNRQVTVGLVVILQISEDQVLREWQLSDTGSLMRQISEPNGSESVHDAQ
jgi:predicted ester cyclase